MKLTALLLSFACVAFAMSLPEAGRAPANAVPFETARDVALNRAASEYPGARPGAVVPYVDEDGNTVAWMFHFRTDGKVFPAFEQVAADVRAERAGLTANADISKWRSRYSFVLVSARYDRAPVLCFGYGTSSFYAIGAEALARAQQALGADASLVRIRFVSPASYFEFESGDGRQLVLSEHFERSWYSAAGFSAWVKAAKAAAGFDAGGEAIHRQEWRNAAGGFGPFTEVYVPSVARAPFYDWSYGCTPTSGAMVLGYIDRTQNYGRLVDWYWQRRDAVEGETDWQIPNTQRECAVAMNTDTTTGGTSLFYIASGLRAAANNNSYSFSVTDADGYSGNDWAWSTITSQIGSGYAFIWSAMWESHSLACFGYRTDDKFVFVHNTWWAPGVWWSHSGNDNSNICSPHPAGGDARKVEIAWPVGDTLYNSNGRGEVLQVGDTVAVTWNNFGNPGTKVDIDLSTNGGRTWNSVATNVTDNGTYNWCIQPSVQACDSARLRLKQYNGSTLTAGDGSFGSFYITRQPLAPSPLSPPNGQQVFTPPVVLVVDSTAPGVDSFEFKLMLGADTLIRQRGTAPRCVTPDSMFIYGRSYKWIARQHNSFGWGAYSTQWSFWVRFNSTAVEEAIQAPKTAALSVAAVNRLAAGSVVLNVAPQAGRSRLVLFDAAGSVLASFDGATGRVAWNLSDRLGRKVGAGLYFARLESGSSVTTRRFVLVD